MGPGQRIGAAEAGTLESGYLKVLFIAEVSRYNQELLSNRPLAS